MKHIATLLVFLCTFSLSARADVLGEFHFDGTLGDNIGVTIEFAVNGDMVAVGEIVYTNHKKPIRLLLVGVWTGNEYLLNEYKADGTVTGCLHMEIDDTTYNTPVITKGFWTNPKNGQTYEMKNMTSDVMSANNPWDYATQETIEGEYIFHQWDPSSNSMKNGHASFRWAGDHKLHFNITNEILGSSLQSYPDRPAELRPYTYNDFEYNNANDCGYSFSAHFFKHFVVLISTSEDPEAALCEKPNNIDGVYFKIENPNRHPINNSAQAQQIQNGDKFWDGAIAYTATKYSNNAVELIGKDIHGDDYSINLIWMADQNEYSVFSRNGAIALRIDESARVKRFIRKGSRDFLVFYNAKGDAAWTMEFYINGELQGFTNMERKLEQRPASEVITSEVLNTTWLARFPKDELRLLRNEILARHGWHFQSKDLQDHFAKQAWYKPVKDNNTIQLSEVERTNLEMIKSEEATPDEYRYSMLSPDMFPGGLADDGRGPEEVDGVQTYTVTNEREFLAALGPNRTIVIAKNVHLNLSRVLENESLFSNTPGRRWARSGADFIGQAPLVVSESETDGQQLDLVNIDNLTLRGAGNSSIEVDPRYSYCLYFINCKNCRVENLTIGHSEYGSCSGGVIGVKNGSNLKVLNCDLYGCGTYGFDIMDSRNLDIRNCKVHDCTYGILMMNGSSGIHFTTCDFFRNKEYDLIEGRNCNDIDFSYCRFYDNENCQVLFNFDTRFALQGCEIHHPTEKLGTLDMADQSGKKNFFSPDSYPGKLATLAIGPDATSEPHTPTSDLPMFLYILDKDHMQMVYWSDVTEPVKSEDNADYYEDEHARWELQEGFRRNADRYTNLVTPSGKVCFLTYTGEVLKDPKGNDLYPGQLHSRPSIPSPGLKYKFTYAGNTLPDDEMWGMWVVVTNDFIDDYDFIPMNSDHDEVKPLPAKVVKQLEKQYKMKTERSLLLQYNDRYSYGIIQFHGLWKTRIGEYGDTNQLALALEVFTVDGKVYAYPVEGHYDPAYGPTWNADDGGEYLPGSVIAFEGPDGPVFCHMHGAPESLTVSLFSIRNGKLERKRYEVYHSMYDEDEPSWE